MSVLTKLSLAGIFATGCPSARPIDLVLSVGKVVTLDSTSVNPTAVAIANGRIVAVGDSSLVSEAGPGTRVVRLDGAVVAPALIDHHVHVFNVGLALLNDRDHGRLLLDLGGVTSLAEVARRIKARAATAPPGAWIVGGGWSQAAWGTQALPTNAVLNAAAPGHPVYLARTDGHAGWLNARALSLAGITAATPDPYGGTIIRGPSGAPTGILLERANELVTPLVPAVSDQDVMAAFRLGAQALAARGVVEVYDAGVLPVPGLVALNADFGRYLALLRRADSLDPLPLRVNLMIPAPSALADSLLAARDTNRVFSPRLRITHLKLFADGAFGSRGAALTHPYADDPATHGVPRMTAEEITDLALRAVDRGLGVAIHAIGDEAVKRALDACEAVLAQRPGLDPTRLRIEHFSYAREEDFGRAVRLGVVLSIQSDFNSAVTDHPTFGGMRVGAVNDARVYAWNRLERMGARLVEGSDYFTRPGPALAGYVAALTLHNAVGDGRPDAEARLVAYRMQAVPAGIRPGAPADLVILSGNPLTTPRDSLAAIAVLATINNGGLNLSHSLRSAFMSMSSTTAPINAVKTSASKPVPTCIPNCLNSQPPMNAPSIPMRIAPTIPTLMFLIRASASRPATPPTTTQTTSMSSVIFASLEKTIHAPQESEGWPLTAPWPSR
jgi:predicted amidohydrolase YtcJ